MNLDRLRPLVALSLIQGLGSRRIRALIQSAGSAEAIFGMSTLSILGISGIGEQTAVAIATFRDWTQVDRIIEEGEKMGVYLMGLDDPTFPPLLAQIADPPALLWCRGEPSALSLPSIAVIGTRRPSDYGMMATEMYTRQLCEAGLVIVSGLAYGIDGIAHDTAIKTAGITVAVLGSGIDRVYPGAHRPLAYRIIESGGCLISEFPPGTKPDAGNFPIRNRVVSGLSLGTLVIETRGEGGSMITARLAIDQNREVFAIPHRVGDAKGDGCNALIQMSGAKLVRHVNDILIELGGSYVYEPSVMGQISLDLEPRRPKWQSQDLDPKAIRICQILEKGAIHVDELCNHVDTPIHILLTELLQLEIKGVIRTLPGKSVEIVH
jgi:DNA processing protein